MKFSKWEGKNILVLGCGDGKEVELFRQLGFKDPIGITMGDINVKAAKSDYPLVKVIEADMHDLVSVFGHEVFDFAYCNQTFEHAYAPMVHCLEMFMVLKPYGEWYLQFPSNMYEGRSKLTDPMTALISHHHPNLMRVKDLEDLFRATGFEIVLQNNTQGNEEFVLRKLPTTDQYNRMHSDVKYFCNQRKGRNQ